MHKGIQIIWGFITNDPLAAGHKTVCRSLVHFRIETQVNELKSNNSRSLLELKKSQVIFVNYE